MNDTAVVVTANTKNERVCPQCDRPRPTIYDTLGGVQACSPCMMQRLDELHAAGRVPVLQPWPAHHYRSAS